MAQGLPRQPSDHVSPSQARLVTLLGGYYYFFFTSEENLSCRGVLFRMRMICLEVIMRRRIPLSVAWESCACIWEEGERIHGAGRPGNRDSKTEAGFPLAAVALWSLE